MTSLNSFKFKIYLPSKCEYNKFREITNYEYLNIVKAITNSDDEQLYDMYIDLIDATSSRITKTTDVTKVDIFCILLNLYILSVSDVLEIKSTGDDSTIGKTKINLYDILDKVTNFKFNYTRSVKINDNVSVILTIPKDLYIKTPEDIMIECIDELHILDQKHSFKKITTSQKIQALDQLPTEISTCILNEMRDIHDKYQLKVMKYGHEDDQQITLNIYNNSMFELLKIIYNTNLQTQYYYRYFASKHMGFNTEYTESISPAELQTHVKFFQQEQDEIEKQREKQTKSGGSQHLGQPIT